MLLKIKTQETWILYLFIMRFRQHAQFSILHFVSFVIHSKMLKNMTYKISDRKLSNASVTYGMWSYGDGESHVTRVQRWSHSLARITLISALTSFASFIMISREEILKPIWHAFTALDMDRNGKVSKSQLKVSEINDFTINCQEIRARAPAEFRVYEERVFTRESFVRFC